MLYRPILLDIALRLPGDGDQTPDSQTLWSQLLATTSVLVSSLSLRIAAQYLPLYLHCYAGPHFPNSEEYLRSLQVAAQLTDYGNRNPFHSCFSLSARIRIYLVPYRPYLRQLGNSIS